VSDEIHIVELDTVTHHSNKSEHRPINRATYKNIEVIGDHKIERDIARKMLAEGVTGQVIFRRGQIDCYSQAELELWAGGNPQKTEDQPEHLKKEKI